MPLAFFLCRAGWKPLRAAGETIASLGPALPRPAHGVAGAVRKLRRMRRARRAASAALGWKSAFVCTALPIAALGLGGWAAGQDGAPAASPHPASHASDAAPRAGEPTLPGFNMMPLPPPEPFVPAAAPPQLFLPELAQPRGPLSAGIVEFPTIAPRETPTIVAEPGSAALLAPLWLVLAALIGRRNASR